MKSKRILSAFLAVCMILCMLPAGALQVSAAETYPVLLTDTQTTMTMESGQNCYLEFHPELSENYKFSFVSGSWSHDRSSYRYWLYDASMEPVYNDDLEFAREFTCSLEAGQTYYLCVDYTGSETATVDVIVTAVHSYSMEVITEATCTTPGTRVYTCSSCGDTYTEEYLLDHNYEMGMCTLCGAGNLLEEGIPLTMSAPASYVEDWAIFKPTVTEYYEFHSESRFNTYACLYDSNGLLIIDDDDSYGGYQFSFTVLLKAGQTYHLSVMSFSETDAELYFDVIATAQHSYTQTITQEATCTTPGTRVCTCSFCGHSYTEEFTGGGHNYVQEISQAATCTAPGTYLYTCSYCSDSYTEEYTVTHHYVDGSCEYCGEALSASGTWGTNATWTLTANGTLTVSGQGALDDFHFNQADDYAPWYPYGEYIKHIIIEEGITGFSYYTFSQYYSPNIVSVSLPESLTEIGSYAFFACKQLSKINFPSSLNSVGACAFQGCDSLTEVVLPEGLIAVYYGGFNGCDSLKSITLPSTLVLLDDMSLANCDALESVYFKGNGFDMSICSDPELRMTPFSGTTATCYYPAGNDTWTADVMKQYGGTLNWLPQNAEIVAQGYCGSDGKNVAWTLTADGLLTFSGKGAVSSEYFDDSIPWYPYRDQIRRVQVCSGITNVLPGSFRGYSNLITAEIADTVTSIGFEAFRDCTGLTGITLPAGLTFVNGFVFYNCSALTSVEIPSGVTEILYDAFCDCSSLKEVTLSEALEEISYYAFAGCSSLTTVHLPKNVNNIDSRAFLGCTALEAFTVDAENTAYSSDAQGVLYNKDQTTLVRVPDSLCAVLIPESVTTIGGRSFHGLKNLTRLEIPATVTTINTYAFENFGAELDLIFKGSAPEFGTFAFPNATVTVYYPVNDASWTESLWRNSGGTITMVPYSDAEIIANGWSGDTTWTLSADGLLTFSGEGAMKNYTYKSEMPWYEYRDQITSVVIGDGITRIGDYAFYGMPLESITIADSVTAIGSYAFKGCENLDGVVLPAGLTRLGESAFYGCTALTAIEIPASLWTVQPYTFKNCTALESVTFNEGNLQKISDGAFYGTGLTELVLPDCLDILDVYAFKGCADLVSITLGSGVTEIREAVFYGTAIPAIEIPEGITKIGPYAFKNCVNLVSVDLPESLLSVGEASFYACTALASLELPAAVTAIGNYAFRKCAAIEALTFGANLETIGESSFYGCTGLTEIIIPDGVTTIGAYAFKTCTGLTAVTLGSGVETIGEGAFNTCTGLKTIIFPASLNSIGDYCFSGSWNLWQLTFEGDAPAIGTGAFKGLAATAFYPADNATWTSDVMQNYGGKITWKAN